MHAQGRVPQKTVGIKMLAPKMVGNTECSTTFQGPWRRLAGEVERAQPPSNKNNNNNNNNNNCQK